MSMFNNPTRVSNDDHEASVSFLRWDHDSEDGLMSKEGNGFSKHESFYRRHSTALTIHIPLFLFNVLLTIVILLWSMSSSDKSLVSSICQSPPTRTVLIMNSSAARCHPVQERRLNRRAHLSFQRNHHSGPGAQGIWESIARGGSGQA